MVFIDGMNKDTIMAVNAFSPTDAIFFEKLMQYNVSYFAYMDMGTCCYEEKCS